MYRDQVKKRKIKIIIQLLMVKLLLVAFCSGGYFLYRNHQALNAELNLAQQNLVAINQAISLKDKKNHYLSSLKQIYNNLTLNNKEFHGIEIEKAISFLSKLKALYQVNELNLKILKRPNQTSINIDEKFIETAQILIEFNSVSDEVVYKFLDSFGNNFPGFIKIINFYIARNDESDDIIDNQNIDEINQLVNVQIIFNWYEFNHVKVKAP